MSNKIKEKGLYSNERFPKPRNVRLGEKSFRSPFKRDVDRIIFSTPFRRLKDKTQVFPLAKSDYVRTRLTHSLEVYAVGLSLGQAVGEIIKERLLNESHSDDARSEKNKLLPKDIDPDDISNIVGAACLAHDMGNPPFGHQGEKAIRHWFRQNKDELLNKYRISRQTIDDLVQFEGNAQGFRLLIGNNFNCIKDEIFDEQYFNLTAATLGTYMKYPRSTSESAGKKNGFFAIDKKRYDTLWANLDLKNNVRHPLSFLMESADDICYRLMDIQDSYNLGIIEFDLIYKDIIIPVKNEIIESDLIFKDDSLIHEMKNEEDFYRSIQDSNERKKSLIECFTAKIISILVDRVANYFVKNLDQFGSVDICLGEIVPNLVESSIENYVGLKKSYAAMDSIAKTIYTHKDVLKIEISGYEIMGFLLEKLSKAILINDKEDPLFLESNHFCKLIPAGVKVNKNVNLSADEKIHFVVDYISGMTDMFATSLYRELHGMETPGIY